MCMQTKHHITKPKETVRSRKVWKPRDLYLELFDCSKFWQAPRQHCCRGACQILKRWDNLNYQSRGFETSRDLTIRCLIGYWNGALVTKVQMFLSQNLLLKSSSAKLPPSWSRRRWVCEAKIFNNDFQLMLISVRYHVSETDTLTLMIADGNHNEVNG